MGVLGTLQRLVQALLVQPGGVERVAAAAVRQGQSGGHPDVVDAHPVPAVPGGVGQSGTGGDDVGAHPVHVERRAHLGDLPQRGVRKSYPGKPTSGGGHLAGDLRVGVGPPGGETGRVGVGGEPAADHLDPDLRVPAGAHLDGEPEPVEQLRTQLPSSGFIVPTRRNRAAWLTETPSRSTWLRPIAAASSSRSTRWSCNRLTSST